MRRNLGVIVVAVILCVVGCDDPTDRYTAASSISHNGLARTGEAIQSLHGQFVMIWGFVDHGNLYGDEGAKEILEEWWSGDGPRGETWRFDLKARADDEVGHSFSVHVPNDHGRDRLLRAFVADARARKPTRVFLKGKLFRYDAPTHLASRTGLYMELQSSHAILLEPPAERE